MPTTSTINLGPCDCCGGAVVSCNGSTIPAVLYVTVETSTGLDFTFPIESGPAGTSEHGGYAPAGAFGCGHSFAFWFYCAGAGRASLEIRGPGWPTGSGVGYYLNNDAPLASVDPLLFSLTFTLSGSPAAERLCLPNGTTFTVTISEDPP